jgi:TatD DNase family protein
LDSAGENKPEGAGQRLAVVDAHCHIDLYDDPKAVVTQAEALCIRTIAVTNAPSVFPFTRDLTAECKYVRPAAGLHPELVHSHSHELELLWPFLEQTRYVGEVGLDYVTTDPQKRAQQRAVFGAIVERCAALGKKILTVHSRRSASDVIATIGTGFNGKAVLHWFSGSARQLDQAAAVGFFFSVNPSMLSSKSGRLLTSAMPRERVLTETDGPFVKVGRRVAVPEDTGWVVQELAILWGVSPDEAKGQIAMNLRSLVSE